MGRYIRFDPVPTATIQEAASLADILKQQANRKPVVLYRRQ